MSTAPLPLAPTAATASRSFAPNARDGTIIGNARAAPATAADDWRNLRRVGWRGTIMGRISFRVGRWSRQWYAATAEGTTCADTGTGRFSDHDRRANRHKPTE